MIDRSMETFSVGSGFLVESPGLRLDASFYNAEVIAALAALEDSGMKIATIRDLTERVFIPNRFKRNYVEAAHGVPFLQGSHMVQFRPDDMKYLSRATHQNMPGLIIHEGWLLITRSGTVGRVALVTSQWEGWAASEHIFRVVPKAKPECPMGYLAAFLSSPIGQLQLARQIYGAVVDELTEEHIRSIRVPLPVTAAQRRQVKEISENAVEAATTRALAVRLADQAAAAVDSLLPDITSQPTLADDIGRDDRIKIEADPEDALRAMLATRPTPAKRRKSAGK